MEIEKKNRNGGIDLVKCTAIFFVISVHFFLNNGYYTEPIDGVEMYISTFLRWLFYICVPLFLLTTGYLMRKKELSKKYYHPLFKILIAYFIISIITIVVRIYVLPDAITWSEGIKGIFSFKTNDYAWYVNMYIGLFLLIPFLNILYNNIKTKEHKLILIFSLVFLTSVAKTYIIRDYVPTWWNSVYPLTYYFIGAFLSEYPIKVKKLYLVLLAVLVLLVQTVITYFVPLFLWMGDYGGFFNAIVAICVFLCLFDMNVTNKASNSVITNISKITLEIYLISYVVDRLVYPQLLERYFSNSSEMLPYIVVIILFVFAVSVLAANIVSYIQRKLFSFKYKK
jgi:surface polysaccharide O-acyltransferase-like enzyme